MLSHGIVNNRQSNKKKRTKKRKSTKGNKKLDSRSDHPRLYVKRKPKNKSALAEIFQITLFVRCNVRLIVRKKLAR